MAVPIVLLSPFSTPVHPAHAKVKSIDSVTKKDMWGLAHFEYKREWSLLLPNFVFKTNINQSMFTLF